MRYYSPVTANASLSTTSYTAPPLLKRFAIWLYGRRWSIRIATCTASGIAASLVPGLESLERLLALAAAPALYAVGFGAEALVFGFQNINPLSKPSARSSGEFASLVFGLFALVVSGVAGILLLTGIVSLPPGEALRPTEIVLAIASFPMIVGTIDASAWVLDRTGAAV